MNILNDTSVNFECPPVLNSSYTERTVLAILMLVSPHLDQLEMDLFLFGFLDLPLLMLSFLLHIFGASEESAYIRYG